MSLTCLILDDEPMARASLQRLCEKRPELHVLAVCENAEEALLFLREKPVELLFLDVELPGLSGLQLLDQLPVLPSVIMTTSKTEYAFDAFQYQVADYLKKPITLPRFMQAVDKVIELRTSVVQESASKDIFVKVDGRYIRLDYDSLLYIENVGDYVKIYTPKESYIIYATMKSLEERLPTHLFFRVHRSFIVNVTKIIDIEGSNLVIANKVIPISRANKSDLMTRLNLL